jgi:chloramphenicol O-acetyltransferase
MLERGAKVIAIVGTSLTFAIAMLHLVIWMTGRASAFDLRVTDQKVETTSSRLSTLEQLRQQDREAEVEWRKDDREYKHWMADSIVKIGLSVRAPIQSPPPPAFKPGK